MDVELPIYEKLGVFYLGREYDLADRSLGRLLLYESKDLSTHAVCVGMTGSGKTGLCISLLEEAAIDGVPALVIDPKGDLSNLLLTFPELRPADFRPWINEDDARRQGVSADDYAAAQAEQWRAGLAQWEMDGTRIARLRDAADFAIYTPGSQAGLPLSILASFSAPRPELLADAELLRDRVATMATSLLGLLGVDADPIRSREHILLSTVLDAAWRQGEDLDLPRLIRLIQQPPIEKIGVIDLDAFYPEKDRFELAMALNNLLAAPGFAAWTQGEPLDIDRLLYTDEGKPRIAILSIAHLNDAERMFFVSLALNETLGWMRSRPGTTTLRSILYMDEIFGYMPPVAEPPSKRPLLTLLKQARAYGLGVVLATQNPVDLDYKGLSNIGAWFLGRLQTERDKARIVEGLAGVASAAGGRFDRSELERTLAGLGKRVFLLHNVHGDGPIVFQSRFAMSYLRGPLTREQIATLMADRKTAAQAATRRETPPSMADAPADSYSPVPISATTAAAASTAQQPLLDPAIRQVFAPIDSAAGASAAFVYEPAIVAIARVHFFDRKLDASADEDMCLVASVDESLSGPDWLHAEERKNVTERDFEPAPVAGVSFAALPADAAKARSYTRWQKDAANHLYRTQRVPLLRSAALDETARPGESERDFRIRLLGVARERRDAETEKLRRKYEPKLAQLEAQVAKARAAVERERQQAGNVVTRTVVSLGETLLSAFLGRKRISSSTLSKASTTARGAGRIAKERGDISRAERELERRLADEARLDEQFRHDVDAIAARLDATNERLETVYLEPRRSDIDVRLTALAWMPKPQKESAPAETP